MKDFDGRSTFLFLVFLLSSVFQLAAQESDAIGRIQDRLVSYVKTKAPEKVYLQTDKDLYTNGETIWFKAYILNGVTHFKSKKSRVVYVELLDTQNNLIAQHRLEADASGAAGDILLPKDIEEGTYVLRAYTKYMLNEQDPAIFQKTLPIWKQRIGTAENPAKAGKEKKRTNEGQKQQNAIPQITRPGISFFPEGGDLVNGLENVLGMKITDTDGNGLALEGVIVDHEGRATAPFKSFDFGLAATYFTPKAGTDYYAQIEFNGTTEKYPVPKAIDEGYVLHIENKGEYINVEVSTNIPNGLKGTMILGHLRGDLIFKHLETKGDQNSYTVKLLTDKVDNGVAHFTLFAPDGQPLNERLTFIENKKNEVDLLLKTEMPRYGLREEVAVYAVVQNSSGKLLNGDFSMSVVTQKGVHEDTDNLKSWLLLNSDLGGTVENPDFFFKDDSRSRDYLLDLLMLTHGWRRFVWKSFLEQGVGKELPFQPEKGIMINGTVTSFDNRYRPRTAMTKLTLLGSGGYQEQRATNAQGKFSFGPMIIQDSTEAIINAVSTTEGKEDLAIYIDPPFPNLKITDSIALRPIDKTTVAYAAPYLKAAQLKKNTDFEYDPKVTALKEVVVKAKVKTQEQLINEKLNERTLYRETSKRIFTDSIPGFETGTVFDLLRGIPGVQIVGARPRQEALVRGPTSFGGYTPPLYLIDGIPTSVEAIQSTSIFEVLFVDVLKGGYAAIYGSRAGGGVIAVYTRTGEDFGVPDKRSPGVTNVTVPGFYRTREFYVPKYRGLGSKNKKPDYRTTLHWEPNIRVEAERTKLNFYTGDTEGAYTIRIEGITDDGRPVSTLYEFSVEED